MDWIMELGVSLLKSSFILVGIYVALGCLLQKKSWQVTISAVFKSAISLILMSIGGGVIGESLMSLGYLFQRSFGLIGIISSNERLAAYTETRFGHIIYSVIIVGMIVNIVMAKKTKFKYIFLTGHQMIYMSCALTIGLSYVGIPIWGVVAIGGIVLGIMMSVFPSLIQPYTKEITGKENIAVGHFSTVGFFISAKIGEFVNRPEQKREKKMGSSLLVDNLLATAISMVLLFTLAAIIAGKTYVQDVTNTYYIVFAIKQGLYFATGVYIILTGVRMMIGEIITAFKGIAQKIVPDAIPALDCSILFPYRQDRMMIGFVFSMIGGIVAMFIAGSSSVYAIIPSSTICFFSGSAAGLYGHVKGGKLGAVVSSLIFGLSIGLLPLLLLPMMRESGFYKVALGEFDFNVVVMIIKGIFGK
ncbi:MAG: PTS ascorbate transporter subunit IIC [Tissierellales bacterium]|jgi:PTS system ascorbate-specific IIC component|nr:PTS ascorbate transporter subunit IIC [Tissierellales bacterium]